MVCLCSVRCGLIFGGPTNTCCGDQPKIERRIASPSPCLHGTVVGSKRSFRGLHLKKRVPGNGLDGTGGGIFNEPHGGDLGSNAGVAAVFCRLRSVAIGLPTHLSSSLRNLSHSAESVNHRTPKVKIESDLRRLATVDSQHRRCGEAGSKTAVSSRKVLEYDDFID